MKSETPRERFRRLASQRTNEVLKRIKILGNCSNKQLYEYTEDEVNRIFSEIDKSLKSVKSKFDFSKPSKFRL